jgi:hypothetical protein
MVSNPLRIGVAVLLLAGGFALGRLTASPAGSGPAGAGATGSPAAATQAAAPAAASREALLEVLRERDTFQRLEQLAALLPTLGPADVPAVRGALMNPSLDLGAAELSLLVRFWALQEPAEAAPWAIAHSPLGYRISAIVPAMEEWARQDPRAAVREMMAVGIGGPNAEAAQIALVRGWSASGQPGLERYIQDLGLTNERQRLLGVFAREMIQRDGTEAVMQWAESVKDEPQRYKLEVYRRVGSELAKMDPAAGAAWCEKHCEGPFGANVREMVAARWADQDGPAAMEWLSKAPEGKERDRAIRAAFISWRRQDEASLFEMFADRTPDDLEPWMKAAAGVYAMAISWERPERAFEWAALIDDDQRRERAFVTIARRWRQRDEAAADAWLEQSSLSEEARERVRKPVQVPARRQRKAGQEAAAAPS